MKLGLCRGITYILFLSSIIFSAGCSSLKSRSRSSRNIEKLEQSVGVKLYREFCSLNDRFTTVEGRAWIKLKTPDQSGQFPLTFYSPNSSELEFEVIDLIGTPLGNLELKSDVLTIKLGNKQQRYKKNWNGFPVQWLSALFRGGVPCVDQAPKEVHFDPAEQRIMVKFDSPFASQWIYQLRNESLKSGVKWVELQKSDSPDTMRMDFGDLMERQDVPKNWNLKSKTAEVNLRFRNFEFEKSN